MRLTTILNASYCNHLLALTVNIAATFDKVRFQSRHGVVTSYYELHTALILIFTFVVKSRRLAIILLLTVIGLGVR